MVPLLSWLTCCLAASGSRNARRNRVQPRLERLDDRIVPTAGKITWTDGAGDHHWSNSSNWEDINGAHVLPDSSTVALFNTRSGDACTFDSNVPLANQTIAGLDIEGGYTGTLTLSAGSALIVSSVSGDSTTGFKMKAAAIVQATASDAITITGGGDATQNYWSGGTINNTSVQSDINIDGGSTFQITSNATTLGDNITVGADSTDNNTLQLHNQRQSLTVINNAAIIVAYTTADTGINQIAIDTDVTNPSYTSTGIQIGANSADSFIDNSGTIVRSGNGIYVSQLAVKNELTAKTLLDVQGAGAGGVASGLQLATGAQSKTQGASLDQEGGTTRLESGATLTGTVLITLGEVQTYGAVNATIDGAVTMNGGTLTVSADNPASYGSLTVTHEMTWNAGSFKAYVNGGNAAQRTRLILSGSGVLGALTVGNNAHLSITAVGTVTSHGPWQIITYASISGTLTFDSNPPFTIVYNNNGTEIDVTA